MRRSRYILVLFFVLQACVEEFTAETEDLEDLLVVDALLTDEMRHHEVRLTRVFAFEAEGPVTESGASVAMVDDQGTRFAFVEAEAGTYRSESAFSAQQGRSYALEVETSDGRDYRSDQVRMPAPVPIDALRAQRVTNDRGEEGVGIYLDNNATGVQPTFFRYEFDETYKIIAPRWDPFRLRVVRYEPCFSNPFVVDIVAWEDERKTCFGTSSSNRLIQASSVDLQGSAIENYQLHFLSRDNYIISHRYSINVRQYAQTQEAYSFYERLGDFSSSDNLFSQVQPGFLEGNIVSRDDADEKVLGYFEVASVSEKRMYFNYDDLFPGEPLPPYAINCNFMGNPRLWPRGYHCADIGVCDGNCESPLIEAILNGQVTFAAENEGNFTSPYFTWLSPCGDCTQLGSNVIPEFWSEE